MSAQIESVLNETRVFPPSAEFVKQANVPGMAAYQALCNEAERDFEGFWDVWRRKTCFGTKPSLKCSTNPRRHSSSGFMTVS